MLNLKTISLSLFVATVQLGSTTYASTESSVFIRRAPAPVTSLETQAIAILKNRCASCHTPESAPFGTILSKLNLFKKGLIVAGDQQSILLEKVRSGEMPKGGPKLSDAEIATLSKWVANIIPPPGIQPTCVTEDKIYEEILNDMEEIASDEISSTRYISIANLENVDLAIAGVTKLLNSLSTAPRVVTPRRVSSHLLRFDLRSVNWSVQDWEKIQKQNLHSKSRSAVHVAAIMQSNFKTANPLIKAIDLASISTRPDIYHLLLKTPTTLTALEQELGVDRAKNIVTGRARRAGFRNSGVSQNNRVIERHNAKDGAYWISYDFNDSLNANNVFQNSVDLRPAGGEVIYHLPNGMIAFMLANGNGGRLDKAPVNIVSDTTRRDHAVTNGVSCLRCHSTGILTKNDEIREVYALNTDETIRKRVLDLYPEQAELNALYAADNRRFNASLTQQNLKAEPDVITALIQKFEGDLSGYEIACELNVDAKNLLSTVEVSKDFDSLSPIKASQTKASIPRDVFEALYSKLDAVRVFGNERYSPNGFRRDEVVSLNFAFSAEGLMIITNIDRDGKIHLKSRKTGQLLPDPVTERQIQSLPKAFSEFTAGQEVVLETGDPAGRPKSVGRIIFLSSNNDGNAMVRTPEGKEVFLSLLGRDFIVKEVNGLTQGDTVVIRDSNAAVQAILKAKGIAAFAKATILESYSNKSQLIKIETADTANPQFELRVQSNLLVQVLPDLDRTFKRGDQVTRETVKDKTFKVLEILGSNNLLISEEGGAGTPVLVREDEVKLVPKPAVIPAVAAPAKAASAPAKIEPTKPTGARKK